MVSGYTGINVPVEKEVNMEIRPNDLGYLTHYMAVTNCHGWAKNTDALKSIKVAVEYSGYDKKSNVRVSLSRVHKDSRVDGIDGAISYPSGFPPVRVGMFGYNGQILKSKEK
jgi:hypothetical protein